MRVCIESPLLSCIDNPSRKQGGQVVSARYMTLGDALLMCKYSPSWKRRKCVPT